MSIPFPARSLRANHSEPVATMIHQSAEVEEGAVIGEGSQIWHICHIRSGAVIGARCKLGRNVYVDSGVHIGAETKIQNNVSIFRGVQIGKRVFIGPHVTFTNDKRPRAFQLPNGGWKPINTYVHEGASIGAGAIVICGFTIGEYAMIGAGAVVCRNIKAFEQVIGNSQHVGYVSKEGKLGC